MGRHPWTGIEGWCPYELQPNSRRIQYTDYLQYLQLRGVRVNIGTAINYTPTLFFFFVFFLQFLKDMYLKSLKSLHPTAQYHFQ